VPLLVGLVGLLPEQAAKATIRPAARSA